MINEPTSLASLSHALARALRKEYGIDPGPVFTAVGVPCEQTLAPGTRFPISTMWPLWKAARETSGDPAVGLRTGWYVKPEFFYALGFSWLASKTLLGAMRRLCRYHRVLSTVTRDVSIEQIGDTYVLSRSFPHSSQTLPDEAIDAGMTALLELCRVVADEDVRPLRVDIARDKPVNADAYERELGAPVRFNQPIDAFYFDRDQLEADLLGGAPDVAKATDHVADEYLQSIDPSNTAAEVRQLLVKLLPSGRVDQDLIAKRLHRSTSSLHRSLRKEGTTFVEILDSTRRQLAKEYLRGNRLSLAEIAYLVGYADQSSFTRAFRRWTNMTPRQFKAG